MAFSELSSLNTQAFFEVKIKNTLELKCSLKYKNTGMRKIVA